MPAMMPTSCEAIAPTQNKLGQFLLNPVVRNILGQVRCTVSFRFIVENQLLSIAKPSRAAKSSLSASKPKSRTWPDAFQISKHS